MAKSASKVFKSIRFAKLDPEHQKAGPFSTDDEEHYTVSTQEYEQQIKHVKKRAMQEAKGPCWDGYKPVPGKKPFSPGSCVKESSTEEVNEDLRKWFSKTDPEGGWKRINSEGEAIGPCAREPGEPKPKCMSNEKRASLTKKERASAVRAKRKHDPNPERKGEPINVSNFGKGKISEDMEYLNEKNVPTSPEKWAQAKAQAKSKFDVYPSAYANGWAAKKYKEMGGGWKSVSEGVKEVGDDPTGSPAQETLVKKGGKTTVDKPIEEATSVAVRMQKALDRIKQKREASEQRAKELLQPKKPEPVKEAREDDEYHSTREHKVGVVISKDNGPKERMKATVRAKEPQHAVNIALNHYKSKGYTVHDHKYLGESVDLEEGWKQDSGWHKSKTDTVVDKSGAVHTAKSKVRDLARRAMKTAGEKQAKSVGAKPMKESTLTESRKTEIIKDAAKKKKAAPDKFEANPTLDSQIQKVDNT